MKIKNKITLPIKVILIGCIMGLIVIGIGGFKQIVAKKTNEQRKVVALKSSEEAINAANERLAEIEIEYNELKKQYDSKENECNSIITGSEGWFEASKKCTNEKQELQDKIYQLKSEDTLIKTKDYTGYYQEVKPMTYQIFYIIGASIAGLAIIGAFIIYLVKGKKTYN